MSILRYLILLIPILSLPACVEQKRVKPSDTKPQSAVSQAERTKAIPQAATLPVSHQSQISALPPILPVDMEEALIRDIVFTPDGRYLVLVSDDKFIQVLDLNTGRTARTLPGQVGAGDEGKIYAMALSPDGQWLAAGGMMATFSGNNHQAVGIIRLYDFPKGKLVALLSGHTNAVTSLAFSPDSGLLVSGSRDFNAILWNVSQQQRLRTLGGHFEPIYATAFSADSKRVVTGSLDNTLRLWQVQDGGLIATLDGHYDDVVAVAISPLDGTIVSGSKDYTISLWDGQTGRFIKTLVNQGTKVGSLSFSPDGRYLVSGVGSTPTNCHVWSFPDGKKLVTYKGHDNIVLATAVSPDGRWAATADGDNQEIHLWSLDDGKLKELFGEVKGYYAYNRAWPWWERYGMSPSFDGMGSIEYYLSLPASRRRWRQWGHHRLHMRLFQLEQFRRRSRLGTGGLHRGSFGHRH